MHTLRSSFLFRQAFLPLLVFPFQTQPPTVAHGWWQQLEQEPVPHIPYWKPGSCQQGKKTAPNNPRKAHLRRSQVPPHPLQALKWKQQGRERKKKENKPSKSHFPIDTLHICCATATQRIRHECFWLNERWKVLVKWITSSLFPMIDSFHTAAGDITHENKCSQVAEELNK